jgi:hypothetical protein|tara:strand:- start:175 stop:489 length:315 start_codon:yes stop_codon:yes gene_type:complete
MTFSTSITTAPSSYSEASNGMQFALLKCTNLQDGTPRRVYVIHNPFGKPLASWEAGTNGINSVPKSLKINFSDAPQFNVTPYEYNKLCKLPSPETFSSKILFSL